MKHILASAALCLTLALSLAAPAALASQKKAAAKMSPRAEALKKCNSDYTASVKTAIYGESMKRTIFEPEHDDFRATARSYFETVCVPHTDEWEERGYTDREAWLEAGKLGKRAKAACALRSFPLPCIPCNPWFSPTRVGNPAASRYHRLRR